MFRSRYKGSQLWGSPVVFFALFSVVVLDMHQKGVLLSVSLCYRLYRRPPFTAATGHPPHWPPFLVSVRVNLFFYLCRNHRYMWCGNTHRTQEENVWDCDNIICWHSISNKMILKKHFEDNIKSGSDLTASIPELLGRGGFLLSCVFFRWSGHWIQSLKFKKTCLWIRRGSWGRRGGGVSEGNGRQHFISPQTSFA